VSQAPERGVLGAGARCPGRRSAVSQAPERDRPGRRGAARAHERGPAGDARSPTGPMLGVTTLEGAALEGGLGPLERRAREGHSSSSQPSSSHSFSTSSSSSSHHSRVMGDLRGSRVQGTRGRAHAPRRGPPGLPGGLHEIRSTKGIRRPSRPLVLIRRWPQKGREVCPRGRPALRGGGGGPRGPAPAPTARAGVMEGRQAQAWGASTPGGRGGAAPARNRSPLAQRGPGRRRPAPKRDPSGPS
jgi:hypothetical protein